MATKKRLLAWILSGVMIAGSLNPITSNAAEISGKSENSENILADYNTSFEDVGDDGGIYWWNDSSWSQEGICRKAYGDSAKPASDCGDYYLEVSPLGDNKEGVAQVSAEGIAALIKPETTYAFTYFAKLSKGQDHGNVRLQINSVSEGWSSVEAAEVKLDHEITLDAVQWKQVSGTFKLPAHDARKDVAIIFAGSTGVSFCIDDLRVAAVKSEVGNYGDNLVKNPNFAEQDLTVWGAGNGTIETARAEQAIFDDITTYGVISNRDSSQQCFAQDMTDIIRSGGSYEYSFWAMLDAEDYKDAPADQREVCFAPYVTVGGSATYWGSYSTGVLDSGCSKQIPAGEWVKFEGSFHPQFEGEADKLVIRILEQGTNYGSGDCVKGKYYVTGVSIREVVKPVKEIEWDIPNLKDTISSEEGIGADSYTGAAIVFSELSDESLMNLVQKHFNAVTFGNEMKMDALFEYHDNNNSAPGFDTVTWTRANGNVMTDYRAPKLNFSVADEMLAAIKAWNDDHPDDAIKVRGHVLVWHSQAPEWFFHEDWDIKKPDVSPEEMDIRQEWYMKSVLEHFTGEESLYKDMFYGWDVVNEAVSDTSGTYRNETENSSWWRVYKSEDFIINAFRYANMYAPSDIELYYNDYNECNGSKVDGIEKLLEAVKAHEKDATFPTRISGMGMQSHHMISSPTANQIREAAVRYGKIVGKIQLTELDLKASDDFDGTDATLESEYTRQAYRFKEIYDVMREVDAMDGIDVNGITVWGVIDGNSWLQTSNSAGGGSDGSKRQAPLLFDDDYKAKPAFYAFTDVGKLEPFINELTVAQAVEGNPYSSGKTYQIQGINATFIPVWTNTGLKVQVTVSDDTVDLSDGVKLYVDWERSMSEGATITCKELARTECQAKESGYVAEFEIPKELLPAAGFGMDIVVTNNGKDYAFNDLKLTQATSSKYYALAITKPYMTIRKVDNGKIVVDAEADSVWEQAAEVQLGIRTGAAKASAVAKLLWDEQYLYVLADVTDRTLDGTSSAAHEQDSLEVFIDENNHKSDSYEEDDKQYRVSYTNARSFNGPKCSAENITSAAVTTDKGYRVEAAFKWTDIAPASGNAIGIELQINDAEGGTRIGTVSWYDESGQGWSSPRVFGVATLVDEGEKPDISDASVTLDRSSYTYDGTAKTPAVTVKVGDTVLTRDTDYTVSYSNNTNVGTASVTVTGTGNYTGSKTVTFTIARKSSSTGGTNIGTPGGGTGGANIGTPGGGTGGANGGTPGGSTGGANGGMPGGSTGGANGGTPGGSTGTETGGNADDSTKPAVTEKPDGSRIETSVKTNSDGSKTETSVEIDAAGTVVKTTETTTEADGSVKEVVQVTEKNTAGNHVTVTTTTRKDADGKTVSKTEISVIEKVANHTTAIVTVKTDAKGKVTATAAVTRTGSEKKSGTTGTVLAAVVKQITEAAGTADVTITMKVKNAKNKTAFVIKVNAADLVAGKTLTLMKEDSQTGELTLVNKKEYTVSDAGNVSVTMNNKGTYWLLSGDAADKIVDGILKTVKLKKTTGSVKAGSAIKVMMSNKLNMANVEKITYNVSDKTMALVNKNGKVKGLKKGAAVIVKAKVALKNGMSKTVSMKVKIK